MKKKSTSKSAFFNLRVLIASILCLFGVFVALLGSGAFAQTKSTGASQQPARSNAMQDAPGTQRPDVVQMVGPARLDQDLRKLPYIPGKGESEERRLTRYQFPGTGELPSATGTFSSPWLQRLMKNLWRPTPKMPGPLLTFEGGAAAQFCGCAPPDSDGDVGPNHYVEAINQAFAVFDKSGNMLAGPITYDAFFAPLGGGTPCGAGQNGGDPFVMYDQQADRWVMTDFAFPSFPGSSFWECIGVSQSPDPVAGPWALYAIQVDPANPTFLGDYPKLAIWNDGGTQNAYFLTMNLFASFTEFDGVRAYALDRASMLAGGPANAIGFTLGLAGVGDSYSFVAANFRTGDPPPVGRDEMVLAVDATIPGAVLTQVHARFFHVDFANPGNATFGVGADHTPNAEITVNPFVQAWTAQTYNLVPQQGTADKLDTLGDKIMTPVVYQNRAGTESLWANQTTMLNFPNGPTAVSWYQFDVTGGNFPATPVQQQEWTNGGDGLFRWMGSIAVDQSGNTAISYATSSSSLFPGIRYAGRLVGDPPSNLGQGEATMFTGTGSQTGTNGRWGDYSYTAVDPADGMSFWTVGEYYANNSAFNWHTRIGKFQFSVGPTPRATPTPRPRPTPHGRP
jgi:hypothetical protein